MAMSCGKLTYLSYLELNNLELDNLELNNLELDNAGKAKYVV